MCIPSRSQKWRAPPMLLSWRGPPRTKFQTPSFKIRTRIRLRWRQLACRPYQESIKALNEDGRRRQREVDGLWQAMTNLREELAKLRSEVQSKDTRPHSPVRHGSRHAPCDHQPSRRPKRRHSSFPDDASAESGHRRVMFQARRPHYHH